MRLGAIVTVFVISFGVMDLEAQITLRNPSFEDEPADATVPQGWFPCERNTTPDILPGFWGVYTEPSDGETFVGLITRTNGTWESIGQRFSRDIEKEVCHRFSLDLARSDNYTGYFNPLKLRVWISDTKCEKSQLIFESDLIENLDWETQIIEFVPKSTARYIIIEAFHKEGTFNYKGNIMIDNITAIEICSKA